MIDSVSHFVDGFLGSLSKDQWDAWRGWIIAIGGLVALFVTTNTYRRNVKVKREEQARLVYSRVTHVDFPLPGRAYLPEVYRGIEIDLDIRRTANSDPTDPRETLYIVDRPANHYVVKVHNGSKELIGPVRVQMMNNVTRELVERFSMLLDTVEPESDSTFSFTWPNDVHPAQAGYGPTILFRDASGQWWRRHLSEPIERVHDDPNNHGQSAAERVHTRKYQESQGIPPERWVKDLPIPLSARWHRLGRMRKGKSPTP